MPVHIPVLLNEVIEYLNPKPGQKFIDATIDGGGHAMALLERITPGGKLLGIEWDSNLLEQIKFKVQNSKFKNNVFLINDNYVNLKKNAQETGFTEANGVLFDLGMSSWHLEEAGRGFTFMKDEALDMRFDPSNITAGEIVNRFSYDELTQILKEYGEERFAKSIAAGIVSARKEKTIKSTFELIEIIKNSVPFWYRRGRLHYATKTFQALRIAVNKELENIQTGLSQALEVLMAGGRLAVISFHSLEDRIVKNFFREQARNGKLLIATKKPISACFTETAANPRARSAKLRVAVKS